MDEERDWRSEEGEKRERFRTWGGTSVGEEFFFPATANHHLVVALDFFVRGSHSTRRRHHGYCYQVHRTAKNFARLRDLTFFFFLLVGRKTADL